MKKAPLRITIIILWILATAWLIRFEAFPYYFTNAAGGYEELISDDIFMIDSWMKISFKETDIGYSHTSMDVNEEKLVNYYNIRNQVYVKFMFMNKERNIDIYSTASLDAMRLLQNFSVYFISDENHIRVNGTRSSGETFDVSVKTDKTTKKMKVDIPDDVVLHLPMSSINLKELAPGKKIIIAVLDPTTMKRGKLVIRALRKEKINVNKEEYDSTVLSTDYYGVETFTWINKDGEVLKQEIAPGLMMEKCDPESAYAVATNKSSACDITEIIFGNLFESGM